MLVGKKKRLESVKVTLLKIFAYKAKECKPLKKKKNKDQQFNNGKGKQKAVPRKEDANVFWISEKTIYLTVI